MSDEILGMTQAEIQAQLDAVNTAITNLLLTSKRYVIGSGASRREFEQSDLPELRELRAELSNALKASNDESGLVMGF